MFYTRCFTTPQHLLPLPFPKGAAYTPTTHPLQDQAAPEPPQPPLRGRDPQDHLVSLHQPLRDRAEPPQPPGAAVGPGSLQGLWGPGAEPAGLAGSFVSAYGGQQGRTAPPPAFPGWGISVQTEEKKPKNGEKKKKSVTGKQQQGHHWGGGV